MKKPTASLANTFLCWWSNCTLRFAWFIIGGAILLCGFSLHYTNNNLGINTDTSELLSPDLPFQKNRFRWEKAFPQDASTILFLVEAKTPEQTSIAANKLAKQLQQQTKLFDHVYIPGDNPFFKQQGMLYLDQDELEDIASQLSEAQPFIGHLAENYSLQGLLEIIGYALEDKDQELPVDLTPLLNEIDDALIAVNKQETHHLSWQKLLSIKSPGERNMLRSLVSAKPKLDFQELLPAEQAINAARKMAQQIQVQNPGVSIRMTGERALEQEEMKSLSEDTTVAGLISLLLVCVTLYTGLGSVKLMIDTFITLIVGLILTAGFAAYTIGHLNILSVAFAVIFIGLAVDFAIHICLRYQECKQDGLTNVDAIKTSVQSIGFSLFLCALTTSIGFLAFVPTDYAGVSELGFISGGGMFIGFLVSMTVLPALLKICPPSLTKPGQGIKLPEFIYTFPFRYATAIRIISILLAVAAGFLLTQLRFDSNPVNLRDPNSESVSTFKDLLRSKTDSPFALIALKNDLKSAEKLAKEMESLPEVNKTILLSSFVAENQDDKLEILEDLSFVLGTQLSQFNRPIDHSQTRQALLDLDKKITQALTASSRLASPELLQQIQTNIQIFISSADTLDAPETRYQQLGNSILDLLPHTMKQLDTSLTAYPFELKDIPEYLTRDWLSESGIYKIIIEPKKDLNITENLKAFENAVQSIDNSTTGLPVGDIESGKAVVKAFIQAFVGALIVITLILLVVMRSIRNTLLVIWPLLLAGLLTAAVNVLLENPFNFANIIVLPLLMGMGVDSGIHIMHRIHTSIKNHEHLLLQTSTAKGVFFSSLTTLVSFTSLAFTPHRGIASMGLLLSVGITFTLFCTLVVLPAFTSKKTQQQIN